MSRAEAQDRHKAKVIRKKAERKAYHEGRIAQRVRDKILGRDAELLRAKRYWDYEADGGTE